MILLIASNGMLGSEVKKQLTTNKKDFKAVDYPEIDVTSLESCEKHITKEISIVINCSGYTAVDQAESDYNNAFKINAIGPRNIAIASSKVDAKIIHVSTDYVFDGFDQESYGEDDLPNPRSAYGKTKLLGEKYTAEFSNKYFILRTSWLFGTAGNNFIETMLRLKDVEELKVVNDQFGSPTSTIDLSNVILNVMQTEKYGIYHATNEGRTTWYEFAKFVFNTLGLKPNLVPCSSDQYPTPAKRPENSELMNLMLEAEGFDKMRFWQDSVIEYLEMRKNV